MDSLRILIADDHPLFRAGLRTMLTSAPDTELVGEATTGEGAASLAAELQPDLVVMDVQMPETDGIEATRRITRDSPHINILVVTMFEDDGTVFQAMRAGARGYVLKGANYAEMLRAIRAVGNGEAIFSPQIAIRLVNFFSSVRPVTLPQAFPELSDREREILDLIARVTKTPRSLNASTSVPKRFVTTSPPSFTSFRWPTGRRPSSALGRRAWDRMENPGRSVGGEE